MLNTEGFEIKTHEISVSDLIQKIKEFSKQHTLKGIDWKILRDEGRRDIKKTM